MLTAQSICTSPFGQKSRLISGTICLSNNRACDCSPFWTVGKVRVTTDTQSSVSNRTIQLIGCSHTSSVPEISGLSASVLLAVISTPHLVALTPRRSGCFTADFAK
jgi:hypothetical protein